MSVAKQSTGATLAPASTTPSATKRVSLLLVTGDGTLWTPFTAVPGADQARQFDSVTELLNAWPRNRPAVVALDTRSIGDLAAALESLGAHSAALVPVALVDEAHRADAAALERQRRLFDHLLLPIDPGTAKTVLDHASEEASARRALQLGDPAAGVAPVDPPAAPRADSGRTPSTAATAVVDPPRKHRRTTVAPTPVVATPAHRQSGRAMWIAIGTVACLSLAAVAWFVRHSPSPSAPTPPVAAAPAPSPQASPSAVVTRAPVDEQVDAQLERARSAMRDRRYIDPADDNALAHYKTVLGLEPANGEARQGLDRIAELLLARAATALASHDNAAALRSLEAARAITPTHPRLAALDAQVGARASELSAGQVQAAMQAGAFVRAATLLAQGEKAGTISTADATTLRQDISRRSAVAQIAELARLTQARISQGQLLEPAGDNAKGYLAALAERGGPAMADEVTRLTDLYQKRTITEARSAMSAGAWSQAEVWVAELRAMRGGASLAAPLQKDLERHAAEVRATDAARAAPAPAEVAPAAVPTAPAASAAAVVAPVITTQPHLAKPLKITYPRAAAASNASGWVEVQAEIDGSGRVTNVRILDAAPKGLFESAARSAVQNATFTPAMAADGSHPRTTISMRLRFQLDDHR